ncbi:hypothetical protein KSP35_05030 [Aquihabitans sp. G128]|uniref:hypothetical protein n=1 Tax=Aquihabitans sp. G128 TaxID=2849779 RepID=UPI001C21A3EB|nr:hypothetical protein [Aquihabitans sp. G128]QXC62176.1 hypothetical protein KSP35_05030 [Aquihabitans sp. G128]
MSDPTDDQVSDATRSTETDDEQVHSGADREPTPEEEAAADALPPVDPAVAESYQHQNEVGADVQGEGQID